jgi:hypothetical protein
MMFYDSIHGVRAPQRSSRSSNHFDSVAMVRWKHLLSPRSTTETAAYCDWFTRTPDPGESRNNCELQFQNDYEVNARQSLIWGGSFFSTGDDLAVDADIIPYRRRNTVESGFAQYGIALVPSRLRILAGSKFEHNQYTGFEYQPQVRAVWTPIHSNSRSWRVRPQWTFGVWGRNLQAAQHLETRDSVLSDHATEVPRSVVFELMWRFKVESK